MSSQPIEHRFTSQSTTLSYFEWNADAPGRVLLLVHATGFHARVWDQVIARVNGTRRIIALDMRGHGRSARTPPYGWASFGQDVIDLIDHLDLTDVIAAGHSMGGHCVVQAAAARPERFHRLLLVDPVILDPELYEVEMPSLAPSDHPTSKRRARFSNWQEMRDRFANREPFSRWLPEALDDYCRWGVLPTADGDVELACPPLVEASIYTGSAMVNIYDRVELVQAPVTVLRAKRREGPREDVMDFSLSPTSPGLAARFKDGTDDYRPDLSHFIVMEAPQVVADYLNGW
ncbi:MAG: alpha/beta hydrolase [Pseudomonadaceae bacterium]|nr:alpha/beta hydrolase [Pseudomonadaceae bacterium]